MLEVVEVDSVRSVNPQVRRIRAGRLRTPIRCSPGAVQRMQNAEGTNMRRTGFTLIELLVVSQKARQAMCLTHQLEEHCLAQLVWRNPAVHKEL